MRYLRGLRVQILLWTIFPLILILMTVSLGSIKLHQESMRDMVAERNAHVAGLVAARLDDQLQMREIALGAILENAGDSDDPTISFKGLELLIHLFDQGISVYDENDSYITGVSKISVYAEQDIGQVLRSARSNPGKTAYQLAFSDREPQMFLMARTDPVTGRSVMGGVSQQGLDQLELLDHVNRSPRREAYLIDGDGSVFYHDDPREIGRDYRVHAGVSQALRGEAGAAFDQLTEETEHVVGYAPVQTTGWAILIEEPWSDIIVPGMQYSLWAPILVLVAAVASLAAVHFGLQRIVHPLQVLGREASRLAWGDFQAIEKPVGGIGEIRDLQSTLQEMADQIHRYQDGMHDYIAVLTQTQEEERKRLARELHDVIVQTVIAMGQRVKILQLDWRDQCECSPETEANGMSQHLNRLEEMVGQCLDDVRSMIRDLRPVYLDELGLVSALEALSRSADNDEVQVTFEFQGEERNLIREANLAIYRIAQAAIHNAVRHGQPGRIAMQIAFRDDGVLLSVEDDGCGFTPPERPSDLALNSHFGLIGMYERAVRLGGHLSIHSAPGTGATIEAFLPYKLIDIRTDPTQVIGH